MSKPSLAEVQRDFFSALLFPLRGRSRRCTELPACDDPHDDRFLTIADRHLRHSPTLQPAECLELYHRQYWFRLLDSIEEDFPGLIRLVGRDRFWDIIEAYLLAHPSASYTLRHLGSRLPGFLRGHPGDPEMMRRAVAVAEIEYAIMASFEAPGLPLAAPEQVAEGLFTLQPHVLLIEQSANASAWLHDPETVWDVGAGRRFHTAVWRTASGSIRHSALASGAFRMLSRISSRVASLDTWLEASANDIDDAETLSAWFAEWSDRGWFGIDSNGAERCRPGWQP